MSIKRVTLELGGKSAAIIADDIDLDEVFPNARVRGYRALRPGLRGADPHPRPARASGGGRRRDQGRDGERQGRRPARGGRPSSARSPPSASATACSRLHRDRQAGGRAPRHRRRRPGEPGRRLVCRADPVRRRQQRHADRPRGDLRPGAGGHPVRLDRRGCRDRQRLRLRPVRCGVREGPSARGEHRPAGADGSDLGEFVGDVCCAAVRRLQAVGVGQRGRPRGLRRIHGNQVDPATSAVG